MGSHSSRIEWRKTVRGPTIVSETRSQTDRVNETAFPLDATAANPTHGAKLNVPSVCRRCVYTLYAQSRRVRVQADECQALSNSVSKDVKILCNPHRHKMGTA